MLVYLTNILIEL